MRLGYFDCFSGVSGDMTLGALVSAGWPAADLSAVPGRLGLEGVRIEALPVRRGPFAATQVRVVAPSPQPHRHLHHIAAMLDAADLPERVRGRAHAVFRRLAEAEAEVHGSTIEKVHFHEVGAVDALVDVVGSILGLDSLGIERVFASALPLGGGFVDSEHGRIPVPAPATALLLRGAPVVPTDVRAELVTPTGAALLATLVSDWGPPPAYQLDRVGTGAGSRELTEQPNVLRILVGTAGGSGLARRPIAVLETALDDENPQALAALLPRLLASGALDAMTVPAIMKKGRAGSWLVVLAELDAAERIAGVILRETSTLGVRMRTDVRFELVRREQLVETSAGLVSLKIATLPDGSERAIPEFESVLEAAGRSGRTTREVSEEAIASWLARSGGRIRAD